MTCYIGSVLALLAVLDIVVGVVGVLGLMVRDRHTVVRAKYGNVCSTYVCRPCKV